MDHDAAVMHRMLADMDAADAKFRPTQFWRLALDGLVRELSTEGLARFRSLPGPLSYFVPTYEFPGYHSAPAAFAALRGALEDIGIPDSRTALHLERLISGEAQAESDFRVVEAADLPRSPYTSEFSESQVGAPLEQFVFDSRRFSRSSLNYLLGLAFLKQHCDTSSIRTVLEIGAGFGSLGEILLADPRNDCFYVDVDIPPTINAATYYLRALVGEQNVLDYDRANALESISIADASRHYKAAALATWQLPKLQGPVDLFVNFISFQEMEPDVVRNYLSEVDRLQARHVLLRNLREGKARAASASDVGHVREPVVAGMYDEFLGRYRLCASNTVPFGYRTVDGFHSELRLYARQPE